MESLESWKEFEVSKHTHYRGRCWTKGERKGVALRNLAGGGAHDMTGPGDHPSSPYLRSLSTGCPQSSASCAAAWPPPPPTVTGPNHLAPFASPLSPSAPVLLLPSSDLPWSPLLPWPPLLPWLLASAPRRRPASHAPVPVQNPFRFHRPPARAREPATSGRNQTKRRAPDPVSAVAIPPPVPHYRPR